jgi:hypothetical protein
MAFSFLKLGIGAKYYMILFLFNFQNIHDFYKE